MTRGSNNVTIEYLNRATLSSNYYLLINHEAVHRHTDKQSWRDLRYCDSILKMLSAKGDLIVGRELQTVDKIMPYSARMVHVKVKWFIIDERMRRMINPLAYHDIKLDLQLAHAPCTRTAWRDMLYPADLVEIKRAPHSLEEKLVHPDFYIRILGKQEFNSNGQCRNR